MWWKSINWRFPWGPYPESLTTPWKRGKKDSRSQRGWRASGPHNPLSLVNKAHMGSKIQKKQTQAYLGQYKASCIFIIFFIAVILVFCGTSNFVVVSLTLLSVLVTFSLLLDLLVQPRFESFHLLFCILRYPVDYHLLEVCFFFLIENWTEVDHGESRGGR